MPFCGACGAKLDGVPAGSLCPNCQMKGAPPPPAFNPNAPPAAAVAMAQPVAVVQGASTVQQQMGSAGSIYPPPNSGQWSTGFCDCCAMVRSPQGVEVGGAGLCCKAFCCLCCVIGDNSEFFANHEGVHCAGQGNSSNACCLWCAAEVSAYVLLRVLPRGLAAAAMTNKCTNGSTSRPAWLACLLAACCICQSAAQSVGAMGCRRTLASVRLLLFACRNLRRNIDPTMSDSRVPRPHTPRLLCCLLLSGLRRNPGLPHAEP